MGALRSFTFFAPVHPVSVNRGRVSPRSFVKSPEMVAYQEAVAFYGRNARIAAGLDTWDCPVAVSFLFLYREDRADNDGPQKPTQDCLAAKYGKPGSWRIGAGVFTNDKQVVSTTSRKGIRAEADGVEVTVQQLPADAALAPRREAIDPAPAPEATQEAKEAARASCAALNALDAWKRRPAKDRAIAAQRKLRPSVRRYTP